MSVSRQVSIEIIILPYNKLDLYWDNLCVLIIIFTLFILQFTYEYGLSKHASINSVKEDKWVGR